MDPAGPKGDGQAFPGCQLVGEFGRANSAENRAGGMGFRTRREPLGAPGWQNCTVRAQLEADACILATAGGPKN